MQPQVSTPVLRPGSCRPVGLQRTFERTPRTRRGELSTIDNQKQITTTVFACRHKRRAYLDRQCARVVRTTKAFLSSHVRETRRAKLSPYT